VRAGKPRFAITFLALVELRLDEQVVCRAVGGSSGPDGEREAVNICTRGKSARDGEKQEQEREREQEKEQEQE